MSNKLCQKKIEPFQRNLFNKPDELEIKKPKFLFSLPFGIAATIFLGFHFAPMTEQIHKFLNLWKQHGLMTPLIYIEEFVQFFVSGGNYSYLNNILLTLMMLFLSGMVQIYRRSRYNRRLRKAAYDKAMETVNKRYEHDICLIREYQNKPYQDFLNNNIQNKLYRSCNFDSYLISRKNTQISNRDDTNELANLDKCEVEFPNLIQRLFDLNVAYVEESRIYRNRINQGESMLMTLPESYQNVEDILVLNRYIQDGRAENWKEVVNLMHDERHKSRVESLHQQMIYGIEKTYGSLSYFADVLERQGRNCVRIWNLVHASNSLFEMN